MSMLRSHGGRTQIKKENKKYDFGLTLNSDLSRGTSGICITFGYPGLSKLDYDFEVSKVEIWALTPMMDTEQATKPEHGCEFVYKNTIDRKK